MDEALIYFQLLFSKGTSGPELHVCRFGNLLKTINYTDISYNSDRKHYAYSAYKFTSLNYTHTHIAVLSGESDWAFLYRGLTRMRKRQQIE